MSRLLNALLDISKLESGAIKPQQVDFPVTRLLEELRQEFAGIATNKGLRLEVTAIPECAHSDASLVGQILRNLISNAIKYTRTGSVHLNSVRGTGGIRIEVLDTGIGIAPDQLQYIYDEFYQVGVPANSSRDGYGLGLSIVQRLVTLLGLTLEVSSEVGKGTVFAFELPVGRALPSATLEAAALQAPQRAAATEVLLVEDDPAVRSATRMLLKVEGYRVLTAEGLAQAVAVAHEHPELELLVTDFHLSDKETGTQVVTALRSVLGRPLKVVLITGDTSAELGKLRSDPAVRVARKPVHADELLALMKSLLAP